VAQKITALANVDTHTYSSIDSIRIEFNSTADSLYLAYRHAIGNVNAETGRLNQTIDTLERLSLPTGKYKKQLSELIRVKQKAEEWLNEKLNALKAKTAGKLSALDLPPESRGHC
jgi:hypothetical protein